MGGIPLPILHADITNLIVSMFMMHDAFLPPMPPLPKVPLPGLIEGPVSLGWPPGTIVHKKAFTVMSDGAPAVQHNHDAGYLIPHIQLPPNALSPVHMAFSKHKTMFPVSSVLIKGSPAGTYMPFLLGQICCNPVGLPTGLVMLIKCTVWTSSTWTDFFKGLANIALDVAIDALWNRLFKGGWIKPAKGKEVLKLPLQGGDFAHVLSGYTVREVFQDSGAMRVVASWIRRQMRNKVIDHVIKSWIATPAVFNLAKGESGLGRGRASVKFFDADWY
jgi:hypothetical protein